MSYTPLGVSGSLKERLSAAHAAAPDQRVGQPEGSQGAARRGGPGGPLTAALGRGSEGAISLKMPGYSIVIGPEHPLHKILSAASPDQHSALFAQYTNSPIPSVTAPAEPVQAYVAPIEQSSVSLDADPAYIIAPIWQSKEHQGSPALSVQREVISSDSLRFTPEQIAARNTFAETFLRIYHTLINNPTNQDYFATPLPLEVAADPLKAAQEAIRSQVNLLPSDQPEKIVRVIEWVLDAMQEEMYTMLGKREENDRGERHTSQRQNLLLESIKRIQEFQEDESLQEAVMDFVRGAAYSPIIQERSLPHISGVLHEAADPQLRYVTDIPPVRNLSDAPVVHGELVPVGDPYDSSYVFAPAEEMPVPQTLLAVDREGRILPTADNIRLVAESIATTGTIHGISEVNFTDLVEATATEFGFTNPLAKRTLARAFAFVSLFLESSQGNEAQSHLQEATNALAHVITHGSHADLDNLWRVFTVDPQLQQVPREDDDLQDGLSTMVRITNTLYSQRLQSRELASLRSFASTMTYDSQASEERRAFREESQHESPLDRMLGTIVDVYLDAKDWVILHGKSFFVHVAHDMHSL